MAKTSAVQAKQGKKESDVVANMAKSYEIAQDLFGKLADAASASEIYEYVKEEDVDLKEYVGDLKCAYAHAKTIFKTVEPTPEQVFNVFDNVFLDE
jgi:hypothetical protein